MVKFAKELGVATLLIPAWTLVAVVTIAGMIATTWSLVSISPRFSGFASIFLFLASSAYSFLRVWMRERAGTIV